MSDYKGMVEHDFPIKSLWDVISRLKANVRKISATLNFISCSFKQVINAAYYYDKLEKLVS